MCAFSLYWSRGTYTNTNNTKRKSYKITFSSVTLRPQYVKLYFVLFSIGYAVQRLQ